MIWRKWLLHIHIEKNVCDSIVGTLLNLSGKTKDGIKARLDLVAMHVREKLAPLKRGQRTYLPPAAYTLSWKKKAELLGFLTSVKVLEGYSSNIRNLVSMKDLKLKNMKSHDCHVLMEYLLLIAICAVLPKKVRKTITKLCFFFKAICSKVFDPEQFPTLQKEIVTTLCELKLYFPLVFFDIMIHLLIYLVREVQLCGPPYLRWMYPIERYMKVLKGYVKNRSRPKGCIVERYIVEEAIDFCTEYLPNVDAIGIIEPRDMGKTEGKGTIGKRLVVVPSIQRDQAHLFVLHNTDEAKPYVEEHKDLLRICHPKQNENWIAKEQNKTFIYWFRKHIEEKVEEDPDSVTSTLRRLSIGPGKLVICYSGYRINGRTFYTKDQDEKSTMQNSGVSLVAEAMHFSSIKDKNPIHAKMVYYGVTEHIWELDYCLFRVPVFGCRWADNNSGYDDT